MTPPQAIDMCSIWLFRQGFLPGPRTVSLNTSPLPLVASDDWSFEWRTAAVCSENPDIHGTPTDNAGRLGWWLLPISLLFLGVFGAGLVMAVRLHREARNELGARLSGASEARESVAEAVAAASDSAEFMR